MSCSEPSHEIKVDSGDLIEEFIDLPASPLSDPSERKINAIPIDTKAGSQSHPILINSFRRSPIVGNAIPAALNAEAIAWRSASNSLLDA